jgi:hypothetical protein
MPRREFPAAWMLTPTRAAAGADYFPAHAAAGARNRP